LVFAARYLYVRDGSNQYRNKQHCVMSKTQTRELNYIAIKNVNKQISLISWHLTLRQRVCRTVESAWQKNDWTYIGTTTYRCWHYITCGLLEVSVSIESGVFHIPLCHQKKKSQFSTFSRGTSHYNWKY